MRDGYYYDRYAAMSEGRWNVEKDIPWGDIDKETALSQPDILQQLRQAAIIEAYHPMSTRAVMELFWDDVNATSVLSVELFEGFRHFWALRRYLERVGFEPAITNEELIQWREKNIETIKYKPEDKIQVWVNFIWSEFFAGYFFKRLAERAEEKVLKKLLHFMAGDEFRHAEGPFQILARWISNDSCLKEKVLRATYNFRHYGNDVGEVPVAYPNDMEAILKFVKRTEQLCDTRMAEVSLAADLLSFF